MSEWITDRLPSRDKADREGYVWVTDKEGRVCVSRYDEVSFDTSEAWMARELPEPYAPPKPKRFIAWCSEVTDCDGEEHEWHQTKVLVERLPSDPADLDAFIEAVDEYIDYFDADMPLSDGFKAIVESRKPNHE